MMNSPRVKRCPPGLNDDLNAGKHQTGTTFNGRQAITRTLI